MKKRYHLLTVFALSMGLATGAFGQIKPQTGRLVEGSVSEFGQNTHFTSSPNLHHHADGEHCIADHLTQDWIINSGIEQQYRAEEEQQSVMAKDFVSQDRAAYTVPIIFHVVYGTPAENVSQAAIYALLDELNADYSATNPDITAARTALGFNPANADIEFCLAQQDPSGNQLAELGINRVSTAEVYYDPDTESNKMKGNTGGNTGTPGWNRNDYVNVWICDITNGATSGIAGYAYKPTISTLPPASIDGIVIDYNLGMQLGNRVLTHEVGHYLGLSHTWGSTDGAGCGTNDGLTDTPNTAGPSFNYPLSCSGLQQTCAGTNTQYENYMDYANCTVMFTTEQCNLMEMVLTGSRNSLNSSDGCTPVNPMPPVAQFSADALTIIQGGSINFTDLSTNYPTSWSWSAAPAAGVTFINGTSATDQDVTMQFTNTGLYTITLVATNTQGSDSEIKTNYINVISSGGGTSACDTLRNYVASEVSTMTAYSVTGGSGYFPGHLFLPGTNDFQLMRMCDSFFVAAPTSVRRIYLPVFQADDMGAANNVTFTVWTNNGVTPGPGAVIGTQVVPIANLDAGTWNQIDFATPVAVNGEFWVGMQLAYPVTGVQDTVIFATTLFTNPIGITGPNSTWVQGWEPDLMLNFTWQSVTSFFISDPLTSLVMDVMVSNGPTPNAVVSFPTTETCEGMEVTMNGFGSTGTTSYWWNISDGTDDFYYDEGNLTTDDFTVGNWTISLEVDGACLTDVSPIYNLQVNPPIDENIVITDENCIAADGALTITASGGDGGSYNYSINTGATFEPVGTYTGLVAGTYNWIITDNNNCEASGVADVGNINTFSPTISPDVNILPGASTTLTVTGGSTWQWYEGVIDISTASSVNVSPAVTTTYYCNVFDGSGCEAELEVTVTVIDDSGIDQDLSDSFSIYPNPTTGKFGITFKMSEPKELMFEVVNIIGEKVIAPTRYTVKDQTIEIDLNSVADGVYFVVIKSDDDSVSKKIIVRK